MRVTQPMSDRLYHKNTNAALEGMLKTFDRMTNQRQYKRASEDPINATRAMLVRKGLRDIEMYNDNLKTAKSIFLAAEENLNIITEKIHLDASQKLTQAANGIWAPDERLKFGEEFRQFADEAMDALNADFAERQLFGGTSNGQTPFTAEKDVNTGKTIVFYNGLPVSYSGTFMRGEPPVETFLEPPENLEDFPGDGQLLVDIGKGISYDKDNDYEIDSQTALDMALNGAKITGWGVSEGGSSLNYVQLLFEAAEAGESNDQLALNGLIDKLEDARGLVITAKAELGSEYNNIDFYLEKNVEYKFNLESRQNDVEYADLEKEAIKYKSMEAAYNAAMQVSAWVLPKSIFDFI